jgi:hypothetical protein
MIITANGSDYKPIPAGTYAAVCTRVIDLGTQPSTYQGVENFKRKVLITWEVPEIEGKNQQDETVPAAISSSYTASLHEKAGLRQMLKSWRGRDFTADELKGFDTKNVLGAPCMISVVHTDKDGSTYANVGAVMALPKGMPKPTPTAELLNLDLDAFDEPTFDKLSDKLREKIRAAPEFKAATDPGYSRGETESFNRDLDDEIPF